MRFLEFINNPQPSPERRSRAEQGEQQWRQQAEQGATAKSNEHWVRGKAGRRHGPFKDYDTANTFRNQRTDVGPSARITSGNEQQEEYQEEAIPEMMTWRDLQEELDLLDDPDLDATVMIWDGGHFRQADKLQYVNDPEMGNVPVLYVAD